MKKSLFIAIPAYDKKVECDAALSLMRFLAGSPPDELEGAPQFIFLKGESHVNRARNRIIKAFLNSDKSHLLLIDSDILFAPRDIELLVQHDEDVVCGLYPKKAKSLQWVINLLDGSAEKPDLKTGLLEIKYGGTGFMLISRAIIERMIEELHGIQYVDDSSQKLGTMWNLFHADIFEGRWLSEDWWFCEMVRKIKGRIYADCRIQLRHLGQIEYPLPQSYKSFEEVDGWFDFQNLYEALSSRLNDGEHCVEVGCWLGRSTIFLAEEIRKKGIAAKIYAVDTWKGTPGDPDQGPTLAKHNGDVFSVFDTNVRSAGAQHIIEPIREASGAAAGILAHRRGSLAWVFIDADHSYNAVSRDIAAWAELVKPDGMIAGHDIGYPDVERAVREAFGSNFLIEGSCWVAERKHYAPSEQLRPAIASPRDH
jgi:SAM-dependent methyltransferase